MRWRQKYKIPDHRPNRVFGHYGMISIEFSVALVTADDGSVAYVSAIMRDVTARRAQEQELRQRLEAHEPSQPTP